MALKTLIMVLTTLLPMLTAKKAYSRRANPLSQWNGEYLRPNQGGAYLKLMLMGFSNRGNHRFGDFKITVFLRSIRNRSIFSLDHQIIGVKSPPKQIWKLPTGKYFIDGIRVIDKSGSLRSWFPQNKKIVHVNSLSLTNLGLWIIKPEKRAGLLVKLRMTNNTFFESNYRSRGSFSAVIDGFTGRIQKRLQDKNFNKAASQNFSSQQMMRSDVSQTRQISMLYRIDLGKDNKLGRRFNAVLSEYDNQLRTCYTDLLDETQRPKLIVQFQFKLDSSSGTLTALKYNPKQFPTTRFRECLYFLLAQIQFPFRSPVRGRLDFIFEIK